MDHLIPHAGGGDQGGDVFVDVGGAGGQSGALFLLGGFVLIGFILLFLGPRLPAGSPPDLAPFAPLVSFSHDDSFLREKIDKKRVSDSLSHGFLTGRKGKVKLDFPAAIQKGI